MRQRFTSLGGYGEEELEELESSTVGIVGLGATGSVIAESLARHGIKLVVVDRDYLEPKDVYSSSIYGLEECRENLPKAKVVEEKLSGLTEVEGHVESLDGVNIEILGGVDLLMDGTDNLEARFLLNEFLKKQGIPWIYSAALGERGYSMFLDDNCFSCLVDELPAGSLETCESSGVMREVSSITALKSCYRAVRFLSGKEVGEELEILPEGRELDFSSDGCHVCENGDYSYLGEESPVSKMCGENKFEVRREVDGKGVERLENLGEKKADNSYLKKFELDGRDITVFSSGRVIVEARDIEHAENLLAEIIGY